jgi:hypothetical protein
LPDWKHPSTKGQECHAWWRPFTLTLAPLLAAFATTLTLTSILTLASILALTPLLAAFATTLSLSPAKDIICSDYAFD